MSYIKINGDDVHYNVSISPFTTQHGYDAIRFIGEDIPETDKGFKLYNDKDEVISDFSDYKYLYRSNEYSTEHDEIIYPKGSDTPLPPSAIDRINSRVSQVSSQVNAITPYTDSKKAYIDETECVFENVYKEGALTVNVIDRNGVSIDYQVVRENNNIIITFEPLEEVATVSINIQ